MKDYTFKCVALATVFAGSEEQARQLLSAAIHMQDEDVDYGGVLVYVSESAVPGERAELVDVHDPDDWADDLEEQA